jgi:hypothetical protein
MKKRGPATVHRRTVFNLRFGQRDGDMLRSWKHGDHRTRRDQNVPGRKPVPGFDDQMPNHPAPVIEVEPSDLPDVPIQAFYFVTP